ncbi:MAG: DUF6265 family protein [Gemmatimonadota bacterium]
MKTVTMLMFVSLCTPLQVRSQDAGSAGPTVQDLAWMAGRWAGESGGRTFEEYWSAPAYGQMTGMFRWMEKGAVQFTELLTIETGTAGPILLIRHFGPGLEPWEEESVWFDLVEVAARRAVFGAEEEDGPTTLIYESADPDSLTALLEKPRQGETSRTEFRYRREMVERD